MAERTNLASKAASAIVMVAVVVGLCLTARYNYLLFHSVAELISIVVAVSIFLIAWNARRFMENHYLLLMGIGLGFVGLVGVLHVLAYNGMNVFVGYGADLSVQLRMVLRTLTAVTVLASPMFLQRKLSPLPVFAAYAAVTAAMVAAIFYGVFPVCYSESARSMTSFKVASEYVNAAAMLAGLGLLLKRRRLLDKDVLAFLAGAIVLSIVSGMTFTFGAPRSSAMLVGHLLGLASFYLIYRALVATSLTRPYELLFRNLKVSEEAFRQSEAKYRVLADNNVDWGFWLGEDGRFIYVSPSCLGITGYAAHEFLADADLLRRIIHPEDLEAYDAHFQEVEASCGRGQVNFRVVRKDGLWRWVEHVCQPAYDAAGGFCGTRGSNRDCTDRILAQQERDHLVQELKEMQEVLDERVQDRTRQLNRAVEQLRDEKRRDQITRRLLELFSCHTTRKEYLDAALGVVQQWAACRCAGIRILNRDGHIPYDAYRGFSEEFWKQENNLSLLGDQCVCTRVVRGEFLAADRPVVTPFGSFICTNSFEFVKSVPPEESGQYRLTCVKYGLATIAVVPLRFGTEILGAIQLADERARAVTAESVEFLESISPLIGEAVHRFNIEDELRSRYQALRESQDRYRLLFDSAPIGILLAAMDGKIIAANKATSDILRLGQEEAAGLYTEAFYYYPHQREQVLKDLAEKGRLQDYDLAMKRSDGESFPAMINLDTFQYGDKPVLLVTLRDMTEHRRLEAEVLSVSEQERQRIGQDLHDSLGQNLTGIAFLASVLEEKLSGRLPAEAAEAAAIERHVNECVGLTRSLARGLSPIGAKPDSLLNGLREFAGTVSELFRVQCVLKDGQEVLIQDPLAAMHMYRIAQEAVHNALKHGKARNINLELVGNGNLVSMSIEDDGVGISPQAAESSGMGLRIMQYRSASIGASLDISPRSPQGTVVTCLLRLTPKKEVDHVSQS